MTNKKFIEVRATFCVQVLEDETVVLSVAKPRAKVYAPKGIWTSRLSETQKMVLRSAVIRSTGSG